MTFFTISVNKQAPSQLFLEDTNSLIKTGHWICIGERLDNKNQQKKHTLGGAFFAATPKSPSCLRFSDISLTLRDY